MGRVEMEERREQLERMKKRYEPKTRMYESISKIMDGTYTDEDITSIESERDIYMRKDPHNPMLKDMNVLREMVLTDIQSRFPPGKDTHGITTSLLQRSSTRESRKKSKNLLNSKLQLQLNPQTRKNYQILSRILEQPNLVPNVSDVVVPPPPAAAPTQTIVLDKGCVELFDPCTREPIANMVELEKRIRDIKKKADTTPIGVFGLNNDSTNYEFLTTVFIDPAISLDDMVSFRLGNGGQVGSDIFEVLSRLFVFFGGIDSVNPRQGGNYKFMRRIEGGSQEVYENSVDALMKMKCKATSAMGISDITLVNVKDDRKARKQDDPYCEIECDTTESEITRTYVMSVKWYTKEKNAEHYDIEKLFTAAQKITTQEQKPLDIIVFLKSKKDFELAHNRSYRQYTRNIAKTFFGWHEDVKPFLEDIRRNLFEMASRSEKTIRQHLEEQYFVPNALPMLSLQLHQDIIVEGFMNAIETSEENVYLIGVLPRGGKTYIAGGIIREYLRRTPVEHMHVVWLTAAPTETLSQVRDDLIERKQDFRNFEFIDVREGSKKKTRKPHSIYFCSTQWLLMNAKTTTKKERNEINNLLGGIEKLSLVFFDEAHKTGGGKETKAHIERIISLFNKEQPVIFLTATYYSLLLDYQIQKSNTFIWDYTDVLKTRALATETEQAAAIENLKTRFGDVVESVFARRLSNNETYETMARAYIGFPDIYFKSAEFQKEAQERFATQGMYSPEAGFSLGSIFAIKPDTTILEIKTAENKVRTDAYKVFTNLQNPRNMVSLLTPAYIQFNEPGEGGEPMRKDPEHPVLEPSILGSLHSMSSDAKSRFRIDENPTLLMFMPTGGVGSNIFYLLCAWASLLMSHPWWRERYEVACVVSEENIDGDTMADIDLGLESSENIHIIRKHLKSEILTLERRLQCGGTAKKGLVILAGEKLSMGISLPCTDAVFLFNEKKSPDDIIQKMYRALTPSVGKTAAFVVDLNPVRTLAALYGYTRASHENTNTSAEILNILYDTYSWDADVFEYNLKKGADARPLTFQEHLRQLFAKAEHDTSNEYRITEDIGGFEKRLGDNIKRSLTPDVIGRIAGQFSSKRMESMLSRIGLRDGAKATIDKTGKLVIRKQKEKAPGDESTTSEEDIAITIENFVETVGDFVKYLAITSSESSIEGAIEEYETNRANIGGRSLRQNVIHMVEARTSIKGKDKDIVSNLLLAAVKEFSPHISKEIFRQMKGKIDDSAIRKDKILEVINKRLTPRQKQKKDLGEVFTPLELIEDMLSHLPKSDWSNPTLKWLDPANGIGNFPVILFYKLDEGLKGWQPNNEKRRKHIIENMLYMIELQSNNNRISRQIFTSLCDKCIPNIWTANTLTTSIEDIQEHFKVEYFDRIIGNPPFQAYQEAKEKRGGGDELYMKFVEKSLDILVPNGYLVFVHPPSWRKPEFNEGRKKSKNAGKFDLMAHKNQIVYLEIHNTSDGMRVFKAGTRYDFYVLKKTLAYETTIVKDMHGNVSNIDLREFDFLPNFNIANVIKLFPKISEESCDLGVFNEKKGSYENKPCILYERSAYGGDKDWVAPVKIHKYKYPLVHATSKDGPKFHYSNTDKKGMFGVPKVIFGDGAINEPFIDIEGKYGMTQHAIGIVVRNEKEAEKLKRFLTSNFFKNILSACMYSAFQIDWRLFTYLRRNFWDIEVNLNEDIIDSSKDNDETQSGGFRSKYSRTRKANKQRT